MYRRIGLLICVYGYGLVFVDRLPVNAYNSGNSHSIISISVMREHDKRNTVITSVAKVSVVRVTVRWTLYRASIKPFSLQETCL